ncbi:hypothetical protein RD110_23695 [Rhodoferax koreense]|uniref:Translocation and assembly module TamB C-terminal domain-containing protein n=1 Tax=Rhodoferax koreensis TaxID=1842727 RepID=A0A1P8K1E9_9BURK|nr:translocation/assembly module TamB domain-containing protein [Rhodoferax koreense]APW39834.1 hypothetical protein RD110_23695 [Rhodoferax koreense]
MKRLKLRHWLLGTLGLLSVLLLAGGAGLWWWTGSDTSLATVLRFAAQRQPIQAEGVSGSLRGGGKIARLQWQQDGLSVEATDLTLRWQALALFDRWLKLDEVHAATLRISDQRPPQPKATPAAPPEFLGLPVHVEVNDLRVDHLEWAGPPAFTADQLHASYQYDGARHQLKLLNLDVAEGHYQGEAVLTDQAPLTLDAQLRATLQTNVPGRDQRIGLKARAEVHGPLTQLALSAQLTSEAVGGHAGNAASLPKANVSARIEAWSAQPVPQADAEFTQLDLATFWPEAPHTRLSGDLQAEPGQTANAWTFSADINNQLPGPWDQQRLPLSHIRGRGDWQAGVARLHDLFIGLADTRGKAQGQIAGSGRFDSAGSAWDTTLQLREINPAALHGKMAAARLNGEVTARSRVVNDVPGIDFGADLKAAPNGSADVAGLRLDQASARGRWARQVLQLDRLQVIAQNAELDASGQVDIARESGSGKLSMMAPGLQLQADGAMAAQAGAGTLDLTLADAGPALRWLQQLPGMPAALQGVALSGKAGLQGRWNGGWRDPALDARLQVAALEVRLPQQPPEQAIKLTNTQATLAGKLSAARLQLDGHAANSQQKLAVRLDANGGKTAQGWQGNLAALNLNLEEPLRRPGAWQLATKNPVAVAWTPSRWEVGAAQAALTAPDSVAGTGAQAHQQVQLVWQPVRGGPGRLQSAGRLEGLPLAWAEALSGTRLVDAGVGSDLIFDGDWDVALADQLRVRANLQRRSGDITLLGDDAVTTPGADAKPTSTGRISAGVREARLSLSSDGPAMVATLRWDSAQAGQADAQISTRLSQQAGQWSWPADAPLAGTLKASLPRIATWSVLAPPGWRVAGTLQADATLAGTRAAPQLNGTLQASGLALRSVVNGISLSDGTLLARLQGNRMRIESFTLKGAGGGSVTAQGEVGWQDGKPGMTIDAVAQQLRVTTQPDRRVTVSGDLKARLANTELKLEGQLKVDQARIMLPEESAPQLGDDVFVRRPVAANQPASPAAPAAKPIAVQLNVQLDLGNDFRLTGLGIDTRLAGKLQLTGDGKTPRLLGTINTVNGEYRAYGQWLTIEQGVLRFTGAYDNPSLDVLAIRPNLTQRVGVQITGTALAPNVRLYASPDLADSEKLAWLVLGRSSAAGGAEAAMLQQAAVALIGGSKSGGGIASRFGLDELSLGGSATSDGTSTSKGGALTLGKRLSRNFYVAYEASLSGAMGTLFVFYDLSQRFTLRGQSGKESAVDLIFTLRYD